MKNEIDRKVKKMKKDEVARVSLLVERASKFVCLFVCLFVCFVHHHSCSCGFCAVCLDMYILCVLISHTCQIYKYTIQQQTFSGSRSKVET